VASFVQFRSCCIKIKFVLQWQKTKRTKGTLLNSKKIFCISILERLWRFVCSISLCSTGYELTIRYNKCFVLVFIRCKLLNIATGSNSSSQAEIYNSDNTQTTKYRQVNNFEPLQIFNIDLQFLNISILIINSTDVNIIKIYQCWQQDAKQWNLKCSYEVTARPEWNIVFRNYYPPGANN